RTKKGKRLVHIPSGGHRYSDFNHIDKSNRLISDVLLVSRLPGIDGTFDLLLFSGGHGAGTQAAELLFRKELSEQDLARLNQLFDVAPYWQFVLEVSDIEHIVGKTTLAHSIKLSQSCPPVRITLSGNAEKAKP